MKTAVRWIFVLAQALFAHCEAGHCCQRPVVGNLPRDCVAWAAVGAVSEWITMPAVPGAAEIPQAVIAGGRVREGRTAMHAPEIDGTVYVNDFGDREDVREGEFHRCEITEAHDYDLVDRKS